MLAVGSRDFKKQDRRATGELDDFEFEAFYFLRFDPGSRIANHPIDIAIFRPIRIKTRRFGRYGYVLFEARNDRLVPLAGNTTECLGGIQCIHGNASGHVRPLFKMKVQSFIGSKLIVIMRRPPPV